MSVVKREKYIICGNYIISNSLDWKFLNLSHFLPYTSGTYELTQNNADLLQNSGYVSMETIPYICAGLKTLIENGDVLPIKVPGDGSCLLHAITFAVWGSYDDENILRQFLANELKDHKEFYRSAPSELKLSGSGKNLRFENCGEDGKEKAGLSVPSNDEQNGKKKEKEKEKEKKEKEKEKKEKEEKEEKEEKKEEKEEKGKEKEEKKEPTEKMDLPYYSEADYQREVIDSAKARNAFLEFIHVFALANVLRRPIIVYAGDQDSALFGFMEHGVAATFLPTRFPADQCCGEPIALAWSNEDRNHFVPLIRVKKAPFSSFEWPPMPLAYGKTLKGNFQDYMIYGKKNVDDEVIALRALNKEADKLTEQLTYQTISNTDEEFSVVLHFLVDRHTKRDLQQLGVHFHEPYEIAALRLLVSAKQVYDLKIVRYIEKEIQKYCEEIKMNSIKTPTRCSFMHECRMVEKECPLVPRKNIPYITLTDGPVPKMLEKILLYNREFKQLQIILSQPEIAHLEALAKELVTQKSTLMGIFSVESIDAITRLMSWEGEEAFPVIDMASLMILHKGFDTYCKSKDENPVLLSFLQTYNRSDLPYTMRTTTLKFVINMFYLESTLEFVKEYKTELLQRLLTCISYELPNYPTDKHMNVLNRMEAILRNFAILWMNPKRDSRTPTHHQAKQLFIAAIKSLLWFHKDKTELVKKLLISYAMLIEVDGHSRVDEFVESFLNHKDKEVVTIASHIVYLQSCSVWFDAF